MGCLYCSWCHILGWAGASPGLSSPLTSGVTGGWSRLTGGHYRLHMGLTYDGRLTLTTAMRLTEALIRGRAVSGAAPATARPLQPAEAGPAWTAERSQPPAASPQQRTNKLRIQVFMQIFIWLNFTFQLRMTIFDFLCL